MDKKRVAVLAIVSVLVMVGLYLSKYPAWYWADPVSGWVVDKESGEPLKNVIIVAYWELYGGIHSDVVGYMGVQETVTNKEGFFRIDGWGPRIRKVGWLRDDPTLIIFKDKYQFRHESNRVKSYVDLSFTRTSRWDGKTIKLNKWTDSREEYGKLIRQLDLSLNRIRGRIKDTECYWKEIPRILLELDRIGRALIAKDYMAIAPQAIEVIPTTDACGSPKDYFRDKLKR